MKYSLYNKRIIKLFYRAIRLNQNPDFRVLLRQQSLLRYVEICKVHDSLLLSLVIFF